MTEKKLKLVEEEIVTHLLLNQIIKLIRKIVAYFSAQKDKQ